MLPVPIITPLVEAAKISNYRIFLKDETKQLTGSFKYRTNWYTVNSEKVDRGIVAITTGNHGRSLDFICANLKIPFFLFIPESYTSALENLNIYSKKITLVKGDFEECKNLAENYAIKNRMLFIHPFENEFTFGGLEPLFSEIESQISGPVEYVFIPVGGGGLLSAACNYFQNSNTKICAVEILGHQRINKNIDFTSDYSILPSLECMLLPKLGKCAIDSIERFRSKILSVHVSVREIITAYKELRDNAGITCELSSAASFAGVKSFQSSNSSTGNIICILTGGNISHNEQMLLAKFPNRFFK